MIARIWHGIVPAAKGEEYLDRMRNVALPDYKSIAGNCGAFCLYRMEERIAHFEMLTFWKDIDSIKRFAGEEYQIAKYYEFDSDYLIAREHCVLHYEVRSDAPDASAPRCRTGRGAESEIARIWRGVVPAEKAEAYVSYLADFGFRDYQTYPGYCAGHLLSRTEEMRVHVLLLSFWSSREAIVNYAGADIEQAHYYSYDLDCLIDPPTNVEHFKVLSSPLRGPP